MSAYAGYGQSSGGSPYAGYGGGSTTPYGGGGSAPKKKGGGGLLGSIGSVVHDVDHYTGQEWARGRVAQGGKDLGGAAIGALPGLVKIGNDAFNPFAKGNRISLAELGHEWGDLFTHPRRVLNEEKFGSDPLGQDLNAARKQTATTVSHPLRHPGDTLLLALPLAGRAAAVADAARAGEGFRASAAAAAHGTVPRSVLETRSPGRIAADAVPHDDLTDIARLGGPSVHELTSNAPLAKLIQERRHAARQRRTEGFKVVPGTNVRVGGEEKRYGKLMQSGANRHVLENLAGYQPYVKATRRLTGNEWTALHIRAMDIHPDDLAMLWKGSRDEAALTPKIRTLVLSPSDRMKKAEPAIRSLSKQGEALFRKHGLLREETAAARPNLTKVQAEHVLGRPVSSVLGGGQPYYFPHVLEPGKQANPLKAAGGGKGVTRTLGSTKENTGALALHGKLHLRSDVLGPEFLKRVKYVKYDEVHNGLVRGSVRVSHAFLEQHGLPEGYDFIREKASTRIPATAKVEGEHVPLDELIPDATDLHSSPLADEGFSTKDAKQAARAGNDYLIAPRATIKAATGEFTRSSDFVHHFVNKPLSVWRALVLGLRPGFLTNNLVGNSIMYGVRTTGKGALRDLFAAILETHGRETALKLLDNHATPPGLRTDLYKEFFAEQVEGTFGRTQSPSTSVVHAAAGKGSEAFRAVTGAIPKLTSKVAEEAPRRALVRNFIRNSPEFKQVYSSLPKQTRTFETAARQLLEGKGGDRYQRMIFRQVNGALGDYLNLSPVERNVLRNTLPFYSWYRAIVTTTAHLAVEAPLRAAILGQIGQIGKQWSDDKIGEVPSFLEGAIGMGHGPKGTEQALSTQSLNPYATLEQLGAGATGDIGALGINPFIQGALDTYAATHKPGGSYKTAPLTLVGKTLEDMFTNLPPSRVIAPKKPSALYPNRNRSSELFSYFGVPIKQFNPAEARRQKALGR